MGNSVSAAPTSSSTTTTPLMEAMRLGSVCMAAVAVVILVSATSLGGASAQSATNVKARYHNYNSEENNWSMEDADTYCAPWLDSKPLTWKKAYGWAAYCGSSALTGKDACGKCLTVTSVETGATKTVRIVDQCKRGVLSLDSNVFRDLDTENSGFPQGYLTVNYQFVSC